MQSDYNIQELELLLSKLSLYRKNYNVETEYGWKKSSYYLTDNAILRALNAEKSTVGVFSCYQTNFFVIDIDNHDEKTNVNLIYSQIYDKLGIPSIVCKSPRGLHVYYCMKDYYDANLLSTEIKAILKLNVEVKPTPSCSIRLLSKENLLDPETLNYNVKDFTNYINDSIIYNVSEFLCLSEIKPKRVKKDSIDIIFKGETNIAMNTLIPQWKSKGFSNEECANKFIAKLDSSYTGDCRNYNHVLKRASCYEVLPSKSVQSDFLKIVEEENIELINSIISHFKKQSNMNDYNKNLRCENIKKIVVGILYAKKDAEAVYQDKELLSVYNTRYPYYENEVGKGNTPLSSNFFKSIVSNYHSIFNYLISIGFIKRKNGRSYDSNIHSCQYYFVDPSCMNKYEWYSYTNVCNTIDVKCYIKQLLTNLFDLPNFIVNLFNKNISSTLNLFYFNKRFNMFLSKCENYKFVELDLTG